MKTTNILILFLVCPEMAEKSNPGNGSKCLSQVGQAKRAAVVAVTAALSSCCRCFLLVSAVRPLLSNNCPLEDVVSPGGTVQGYVFPGDWVNIEGSQKPLEGVFEVLSLTTILAHSC